ncbi:MAG: bifunctional (p)ppGpp synthetase/guanosine-3',5'-bis(diphosphate) 3'-pyrophosphohydrolase [Gemmatimonadetes bacterium]|nr:bifunctional (p)ppGpp synthetase/guanosine-3',5'-bis(diphosphate) 3'-pyrophosphohydrolase [Gemmatimonadota bacterium]
MAEPGNTFATLLKALHFAAQKHRDQRRKGREASPYINHPIQVAEILARLGGVADVALLQGAILHDTIEDTQTTPEELETHFGSEVRRLVEEVTDDKKLPKQVRKQLQIEHAPHLSDRAKQIKIADKICNVRDITHAPPADWTLERRQEYLAWTERVVAGCRGCNRGLEKFFDETVAEGRRLLSQPA